MQNSLQNTNQSCYKLMMTFMRIESRFACQVALPKILDVIWQINERKDLCALLAICTNRLRKWIFSIWYSSLPNKRKVWNNSLGRTLDWPKNVLSSQTKIFTLGTTFSHCLGQKQYRKVKNKFFHWFFHPAQAIQSFTT